MIEIEAEISTREGRLPTFIVRPDEGGPHPIVIIYMDALGIREELRDMSRRIASCGYYVMLPNLFYRWGGPSFDPKPLASGVVDPLMIELNELLSMAMTAEDSASLLDHAAADGAARMLVATIGYCMGGRHALAAAAAYPEKVAAFASLHGGRLVTDRADSPHLKIQSTRAEAYFGWADSDALAPIEHMRAVEAALTARGGRWRVELHRGALHGFTFPERHCYDKAAAERVWSRLFSMLARALGGSDPRMEGKTG